MILLTVGADMTVFTVDVVTSAGVEISAPPSGGRLLTGTLVFAIRHGYLPD